jgi:hypothetical protein
MKAAIALLPLDFAQGNIIDVMVRPPCRVLGITLIAEPQGLVLAQRNGKQKMVARVALVIEIDPTAAEVPRRFVGLPVGLQVDTSDPALACESLTPCGVAYVPPHNQPFAVYEAPAPAEAVHVLPSSPVDVLQ